MSNAKKNTKPSMEDLAAAIQALIAQGRKDGMIRASDLNAHLEKMDLSPEKIEEIYDRFEAMNIQIVSADLDLDLGDDRKISNLGKLGHSCTSIIMSLRGRGEAPTWQSPNGS